MKTYNYWQNCFHKWESHHYRKEIDDDFDGDAVVTVICDDEEFEFIFQKNGYTLINPLFKINTIFQGINNKIKGTLISGIIDGDGNGYGAKSEIVIHKGCGGKLKSHMAFDNRNNNQLYLKSNMSTINNIIYTGWISIDKSFDYKYYKLTRYNSISKSYISLFYLFKCPCQTYSNGSNLIVFKPIESYSAALEALMAIASVLALLSRPFFFRLAAKR